MSNSHIPSYLYTPPTTLLDLPVETRVQELPFSRLSWEDFEKLCLRLVHNDSENIHCQLYGERGQEQSGIDLYAREKSTHIYKVYQCKRVKKFGPAKIKDAVDKFIGSDWAKKANVFVLCTSESMTSKDRAEEIEIQSRELQKINIEFKVWDSTELSIMLKRDPELIDDFFGRHWVTAFCGVKASENLKSRFDKFQLTELRSRLYNFYNFVFNTHDPGLRVSSEVAPFPVSFQERCIIPDIIEKLNISQLNRDKTIFKKEDYLLEDSDESVSTSMVNTELDQRIDIGTWLLRENKNVILGGPGSGKSTFLRYLAIDILSESPTLTNVVQKWGSHIPIWIPFALWTKHLSTNHECSLTELLKLWFSSWNEDQLWPLIENALVEERLLLLVDGLDESANITSSQVAMDRLNVFIEQRKLPVVITSRPHGFSKLIINPKGLQIGDLSPLSSTQQKEISCIWFSLWTKQVHNSPLTENDLSKNVTYNMGLFLNELDRSQDLKELVKIPLLLTLLISLWLYEKRLPQNRFKAYDKLVDHLISIHPQRRKTAAGLTAFEYDISDEDIKNIFSYLAYNLHDNYLEGVIEKSQALSIIEAKLINLDHGLGLPIREAKKLSRSLIEIGENTTGLLVKRSQNELGFFHRAFQEYLTAYYIMSLPFETQLQIIVPKTSDPQWHEIILALMQINPRSDEVRQLVRQMKDIHSVHDKDYIDLLLYEATFGPYNLPLVQMKELAKEAFSKIENESNIPISEKVLEIILQGLRSPKIKETVLNKVKEWFPCKINWRRDIFLAVANWEITEEIASYLFRGLFDESLDNKIGAAEAIILIKDKLDLSEKLIRLIKDNSDPLTSTGAFHALIHGWIDNVEVENLIDAFRTSQSAELRFYSIWGRVLKGIILESDLKELLKIASRGNYRFDYSLKSRLSEVINSGWPNSSIVKSCCLESIINRNHFDDCIDLEIAYDILLSYYFNDNDIVNLVISEFEKEYPFLSSHRNWLFLNNFQGDQELIAVIDKWILDQEHRDLEISNAALVGKTNTGKEKLISILPKSSSPHLIVHALLEGWGMDDQKVFDAINTFTESISNASKVALHLPKIINNKEKCSNRLLEIIKHEDCERYDFCLMGFNKLGFLPENLLQVLIDMLSIVNEDDLKSVKTFLFMEYASDVRVRELAKRELLVRGGDYLTLAEMFSDDKQIRSGIIQLLCPLHPKLRRIIAKELGNYTVNDDNYMSILRGYDHETDLEAKTEAAIGYYKYVKSLESDLTPELEILSESIVCVGYDYQERRQAAFAGLVILKRLDLMLSAQETIGAEKRVSISITRDILYSNIPLLKLILENWGYLEGTFGSELFFRISKFANDPIDVWDELCILLNSDYPLVLDSLFAFLETRKERDITPNILRVLSREKPKSELLRLYLIEQIIGGEQDASRKNPETYMIASEILGEHYGGQEQVLESIMENQELNAFVKEPIIISLCEGWPDSEQLDTLFTLMKEEKRKVSLEALYQVMSIKSSSESLVERLLLDLHEGNLNYIRRNKVIIKCIVRRLRQDLSLKNLFIETLKKSSDVNEKFVLLKLLVLGTGLGKALEDWVNKELERHKEDLPGVFGFDISTGNYISYYRGIRGLVKD